MYVGLGRCELRAEALEGATVQTGQSASPESVCGHLCDFLPSVPRRAVFVQPQHLMPVPCTGFLLLCPVRTVGTIGQDQSFCHELNRRSSLESEGVGEGDGH